MNIVFDLDSTLVTIEGIDELGKLKHMEKHIADLTDKAMSGNSNIAEIFEKRLQLLQPARTDFELVGSMYLENIMTDAKSVISVLLENHDVFIVTGGYDLAVLPVATYLGIDHSNVFSNQIKFDSNGNYYDLDKNIPLWKRDGKKEIVEVIRKQHPGKVLMIGDGITDLEAGADYFLCFTGVTQRKEVVERSQHVISSLGEIMNFLVYIV